MSVALPPGLLNGASALFRPSGRFAYFFARGKLRHDPLFRLLLQRGVLPGEGSFLDLGCGQGCWFAWLLAARQLHERGLWPADWAKPPQAHNLHGVELTPNEAQRAVTAFAPYPQVSVAQGDMCAADLGQPDLITVFDALHYLPLAQQEALLARIRAALPPGGVFITRVGNAGASWRSRWANAVDHTVSRLRGYGGARLHDRPLAEWLRLLRALGFVVDTEAMGEDQPFGNVVLVCRVPLATDSATGGAIL